jgi:hypothetical protein
VKKGKKKQRPLPVQVECKPREHAFLFQVPLKPTLPHGEGRPTMFAPSNEGVERGMAGSQADEGGLVHSPGNLHEPQSFLLLACLTFTLHQNILLKNERVKHRK